MPATNSPWYISLPANCRAGSRHRPFCNNSIGEELLLRLEANRLGFYSRAYSKSE